MWGLTYLRTHTCRFIYMNAHSPDDAYISAYTCPREFIYVDPYIHTHTYTYACAMARGSGFLDELPSILRGTHFWKGVGELRTDWAQKWGQTLCSVIFCFFFPDSRVRLKGFCLFVIKSCRLKSIILLKWTQPKDSRAGSCRRSHRGPHYPLSSRSGSTCPSAFKTLNPESPSDIVSGYIQENGLRWVKG